MPIYTNNNVIIAVDGKLATTDDFCCGACCINGECSDKTKCECSTSSGTFHAGKKCSEIDCSSSSSSSYESSSSSTSDYGACCVATQYPPTYSSSCTTYDSPGSPGEGTYTECVEIIIPGEIHYTCTTGTYEDCYIKGGVFYVSKTCAQIWCGDSSSSSSSSSKSSSSKPSRRSGWACHPVWVCKPQCDDDNPCKTRCDLTVALELILVGECPPGFTLDNGVCRNSFDVVDCADCDISAEVTQWLTDNNILGADGDIQRHCNAPICCGGKCLPVGSVCCDNTTIKDPETDTGCCLKDDEYTEKTKAECDAVEGVFSICAGPPCPKKCIDGEAACPDGICDCGGQIFMYCCPDGRNCAASLADCPAALQMIANNSGMLKLTNNYIYICDD